MKPREEPRVIRAQSRVLVPKGVRNADDVLFFVVQAAIKPGAHHILTTLEYLTVRAEFVAGGAGQYRDGRAISEQKDVVEIIVVGWIDLGRAHDP